jgi:hypothetical protein
LAATEGASGEAWDSAMRALREFQELDAHLCRGEQLPEPWATAARNWDYTSSASRQAYAKIGAYLRVGEAELLACRDASCDPANPRHASWCRHFQPEDPEPPKQLPPNVLAFRRGPEE